MKEIKKPKTREEHILYVERFARDNGYLKYTCRSSHCSYEAMEEHLRKNFLG